MEQTPEPFFIYINDVPCRIEPSKSQLFGTDSCLIIPRHFLNGSVGTGDILLRDVTGLAYDDKSGLSVAEEALKVAASRQGFLLLPDPVTGLVRVERYHLYQTARFVGETLVLTGRFQDQSVVPPSTTMADAEAVNSLVAPTKHVVAAYSNGIANEMLGFARFLNERSGGSSSVAVVTSDWRALPEDVKRGYCEDAAEMAESSSKLPL